MSDKSDKSSVVIPVEDDIEDDDSENKQNDDREIEKHDNIPHNGNPISMIEISPNGKYLVTYSEDDETIVGWNVEYDEIIKEEKDDPKKIKDLKQDKVIKECKHIPNNTCEVYPILQMCVSDQNILAYIDMDYEMSK